MNRDKGGNGLDAAVASSILVLVNIAFQPIDSLCCLHERVHIQIPAGATPRRGKIDDGGSLKWLLALFSATEELFKVLVIH